MVTLSEVNQLNDYCLSLLKCTDYLRKDEKTQDAYLFTKSLFNSIRKLTIATTMRDKMIICVSGLQGAGKTTLMKSFYDLDDKFLNISRGRGESIPILITENDVNAPEMYEKIIERSEDGQYIINTISVDADKFVKDSKGEDDCVVFLELVVPYKHTFNNGISFMLLPGFEKNREYWNNLIEFSVNSSDAAIFVFNETSFSNADNDDYIRIIKEKFGNNVLYAITGSDGSLDDNAEVKNTCIEVLKLPSNETDRVICTGLYNDAEKNQNWINLFKESLQKYIYSENQQLQKNSEYVLNEIENIEDILYQILNIVNENSCSEINELQEDALLKVFDRVCMKKRKELEQHLADEFGNAKSESVDKLEKEFSTVASSALAIKRQIFGTTPKDLGRSKRIVQDAINGSGNMSLPKKYLGRAISNTIRSYDFSENQQNYIEQLVDKKYVDNKNELVISDRTKALSNDVKMLLADYNQNKPSEIMTCQEPKKLMGAVVELGTYYFGLVTYDHIVGLEGFDLSKTNYNYEEMVQKAISSANLAIDNMKDIESTKKFAAGLLGVMGIDVITDGTIDLALGIATAFGLSNPATAMAIATGGCVAGMAIAITRDVNNMKREDFLSAKLAVEAAYDDILIYYMNKYDYCMEIIRERIQDNIVNLSGNAQALMYEYNAKIMINKVLDLIKSIKNKNCLGDVYGLESAFR